MSVLDDKDLHQAVKDSRDTMQFLNEQNLTTKTASPKSPTLSVPLLASGAVFLILVFIIIIVRKNSHA